MSWLPAYEAAKALVEVRNSSEPVLHLVHPRPQPWHTVIIPLAMELDVPLVPYSTWVAALQDDAEDTSLPRAEHIKRNPALCMELGKDMCSTI